jgi:hypothetical protein
MQKRTLKFEQFLVWIFTAERGQSKIIRDQELTRGFRYPDGRSGFPLNSVQLYTRGRFVLLQDRRVIGTAKAGEGALDHIEAEHLNRLHLFGTEPENEYHCILPREHEPRLWQRRLLPAGETELLPHAKSFVYLATGYLESVSKQLKATGPILVDLSGKQGSLVLQEGAVAAHIWL